MKDWHPDKFQDPHDLRAASEAESKSKHIIEAYHFLVSIAPETCLQSLPEYNATIATSAITSYDYKAETLQINFFNGLSYEYFGVPKAVYVKLINAPAPARFARRHIFNSFPYRIAAKTVAPN